MGYESKVYVVDVNNHNESVFCDEIAKFDLSKCGELPYIFHENTKELYVFDDSKNYILHKDCYGEPLKIANVDEVIDCIMNSSDLMKYRRTKDLLLYLLSAKNHYENLWLLHYGY